MADSKVSALASLGTPVGTDYVYGVLASGPTSKQLLMSDLRDYTNLKYSAYSTDAALACAVNTLYGVDISGFTTGRTATLPGTAAVGDSVGFYVTGTNTTYGRELAITATAGDTLGGVAGGTAYTNLFNVGDFLVCRCIVANTTWIVEQYRAVSNTVLVTNDGVTSGTALTRNAYTQLTDQITTVSSDPSGEWDTTNKRYKPRRGGIYFVVFSFQIASVQTGSGTQAGIYKNGSILVSGAYGQVPAVSYPVTVISTFVTLAAGDYIDVRAYYEDGSTNRSISPSASNTYVTAVRIGG